MSQRARVERTAETAVKVVAVEDDSISIDITYQGRWPHGLWKFNASFGQSDRAFADLRRVEKKHDIQEVVNVASSLVADEINTRQFEQRLREQSDSEIAQHLDRYFDHLPPHIAGARASE